VGHALRRAQLAYRLAMDRALQPTGVTTRQFQVLDLVATEPGISSADLARRSEVTAQTMKDVVRNLERAGLVERDPHPTHGRILTLRLTPRGHASRRRCTELAADVERQMLAELSADERDALLVSLRRIGDALCP
jgi:DNA-binding MarR family transcriptional regulator